MVQALVVVLARRLLVLAHGRRQPLDQAVVPATAGRTSAVANVVSLATALTRFCSPVAAARLTRATLRPRTQGSSGANHAGDEPSPFVDDECPRAQLQRARLDESPTVDVADARPSAEVPTVRAVLDILDRLVAMDERTPSTSRLRWLSIRRSRRGRPGSATSSSRLRLRRQVVPGQKS